jgi:hypothetical protein
MANGALATRGVLAGRRADLRCTRRRRVIVTEGGAVPRVRGRARERATLRPGAKLPELRGSEGGIRGQALRCGRPVPALRLSLCAVPNALLRGPNADPVRDLVARPRRPRAPAPAARLACSRLQSTSPPGEFLVTCAAFADVPKAGIQVTASPDVHARFMSSRTRLRIPGPRPTNLGAWCLPSGRVLVYGLPTVGLLFAAVRAEPELLRVPG